MLVPTSELNVIDLMASANGTPNDNADIRSPRDSRRPYIGAQLLRKTTMQDTNKAITSLVRSMKRTLKDKHGIDVPHSALRASYLQALGENPHAFAGRVQAEEVKVETTVQAAVAKNESTNSHTLYLAPDDVGCMERLALDREGTILLPEDFEFGKALLVSQFAEVPRVSRYGLPEYLVNASKFYASFGLEVSPGYTFWHKDLGDDSGDQCKLVVSMDDAEWNALLNVVLEENPSFHDEIAEWVGLHYRRVFENESTSQQLDWVARFLAAKQEAEDEDDYARQEEPESARVEAKFEWQLTGRTPDSVDAYVELDTGLVVFQDHVPKEVWHNAEFAQIRVPHKGDSFENGAEGEIYPTFYQRYFGGGGSFKVNREVVQQIAAEYDLTVSRR